MARSGIGIAVLETVVGSSYCTGYAVKSWQTSCFCPVFLRPSAGQGRRQSLSPMLIGPEPRLSEI